MIQQHTSIWLYQQQKQKNQNVIEIKTHVHFGLYLAFAWHAAKKKLTAYYIVYLSTQYHMPNSLLIFFFHSYIRLRNSGNAAVKCYKTMYTVGSYSPYRSYAIECCAPFVLLCMLE